MIRGLYRTHDLLLGDVVRVHWSAGDAAPIVSEQVYVALDGHPALDALPNRTEYEKKTYLFEPDLLEIGD